MIGNISTDTTAKQLAKLYGLRTTPNLRESVRIELIFDPKHKFKRYAIIDGPIYVLNKLVSDCQGYTFKNRELILEFDSSDKSALPKRRRASQRGGFKKTSVQNSGHKTDIGESRPAPSAPSRPQEGAPCTNREQGKSRGVNPEMVGGGTDNFRNNDRTTAQHFRAKNNRNHLEAKKRCQLLTEVRNYHLGIPHPDASVVY